MCLFRSCGVRLPFVCWLQAEVKRATRRNLRGRRFGLDKNDISVNSDAEQPPVNDPLATVTGNLDMGGSGIPFASPQIRDSQLF